MDKVFEKVCIPFLSELVCVATDGFPRLREPNVGLCKTAGQSKQNISKVQDQPCALSGRYTPGGAVFKCWYGIWDRCCKMVSEIHSCVCYKSLSVCFFTERL